MTGQVVDRMVLAESLDIMNYLVSTDLCVLGEHGECQQHSWLVFDGRECPHARARRMLNEYAEVWLP